MKIAQDHTGNNIYDGATIQCLSSGLKFLANYEHGSWFITVQVGKEIISTPIAESELKEFVVIENIIK